MRKRMAFVSYEDGNQPARAEVERIKKELLEADPDLAVILHPISICISLIDTEAQQP